MDKRMKYNPMGGGYVNTIHNAGLIDPFVRGKKGGWGVCW